MFTSEMDHQLLFKVVLGMEKNLFGFAILSVLVSSMSSEKEKKTDTNGKCKKCHFSLIFSCFSKVSFNQWEKKDISSFVDFYSFRKGHQIDKNTMKYLNTAQKRIWNYLIFIQFSSMILLQRIIYHNRYWVLKYD